MSVMPLGDEHRQKRVRNYALGGALVAFVVLLFFVTIVRMGGL